MVVGAEPRDVAEKGEGPQSIARDQVHLHDLNALVEIREHEAGDGTARRHGIQERKLPKGLFDDGQIAVHGKELCSLGRREEMGIEPRRQ